MKAALLILAAGGALAVGSSFAVEHYVIPARASVQEFESTTKQRLDVLDRRISDLEGYRAHLRKLDSRVGQLEGDSLAHAKERRRLARTVAELVEQCSWFETRVEELRR